MTTLTKEELEEDTIEASFENLQETGIKVDGKGDEEECKSLND